MTHHAADLRDDRHYAARLGTAFHVLLVLTTGLIVLGALVRAHGAGLACPDWPLCFGQFIPEMDLRVGFEWTHRLVAGGISLGFVALGALVLRRPASRASAGRLWGIAAGVLAVQVLLGALTVWKLLAEWTVTSHLVTGNAFNVCLLLLGLRLREGTSPSPRPSISSVQRAWVGVAAALLVLQIVLGGLVSSSYAGLACADWPTCNGNAWFPWAERPVTLHLLHRINGYALFLALAGAWLAARGRVRLHRLCGVAWLLCLAQLAVGVANVLLRLPVEVTALHSALAAVLVLVLAGCLREAWRAPLAAAGT